MIDEPVSAGLQRVAARLRGPAARAEGIERVSAGASQEIWLFRSGAEAFVLRRAPPALAVRGGTADMETEAALIAAAAQAGAPVAQVVCTLSPEDGLGEGFVSRFVSGETVGAKIVRNPALMRDGALGRELGAALASIHGADAATAPGLQAVGVAATVDSLRRLYRSDPTPRPVIALALRWLDRHRPQEPERPGLVHGDYRIGNVIVSPNGLKAVLDWELAHLGDPVEDLAWITLPAWRFSAPHREVGGVAEEADFLAAYAAAGGAPPEPERLRFWKMAGSVRWALICAHSALRFFSGEDRTPERALIARRASESEYDLMRMLVLKLTGGGQPNAPD